MTFLSNPQLTYFYNCQLLILAENGTWDSCYCPKKACKFRVYKFWPVRFLIIKVLPINNRFLFFYLILIINWIIRTIVLLYYFTYRWTVSYWIGTDYNYSEVADAIKDTVAKYSAMPKNDVESCRRKADALSKKALWSEFIEYYYEAYDIALRKAQNRMNK